MTVNDLLDALQRIPKERRNEQFFISLVEMDDNLSIAEHTGVITLLDVKGKIVLEGYVFEDKEI